MRTAFAIVIALCAAAVGGSTASAAAGAPPADAVRRPNVLFLLVDDLGWRDTGAYGSTFYETPHADRLAREGMRFTDAYAASPVCSPSRAALMTGKNPARLRITDYLGAKQPETWVRNTKLLPARYEENLPLAEVTVAEAFQQTGYATVFAGKWHLGETPAYWPEHQGFDVNRGGTNKGQPYGGKGYFSPYGNPRLKDGPPGEHLPDRLATEVVRFLEDHRGQPFFAYLSFYSVHTPLMARPDLQAKYEAKREKLHLQTTQWSREGTREVRQTQNDPVYAGMVEAMDQAVGKVLTALDRLGLAENTIVVFTSDNGGLSTSPEAPTSNAPLRAGKAWLYEGGIRVPLIVRWPGVTKPNSVCRVPVIDTDLYPTLLAAAGLPPRPAQTLDGANLGPLLAQTGALDRTALYWHFPHYGNCGGAPSGAIRAGDWKWIRWYEDDSEELFNLQTDPGEQRNLAAAEPARARAMREKFTDWLPSQGARLPAVNPRYDPAGPNHRTAPPPL